MTLLSQTTAHRFLCTSLTMVQNKKLLSYDVWSSRCKMIHRKPTSLRYDKLVTENDYIRFDYGRQSFYFGYLGRWHTPFCQCANQVYISGMEFSNIIGNRKLINW